MSYDCTLCDPVSGETLRSMCPHQIVGGTYCATGTDKLWLNVTYNYWPHLWRVLGTGGLRSLHDKSGAESIPLLEQATVRLGRDVSDDYWAPTEGNARRALCQLLALARMRPDGVWRIS